MTSGCASAPPTSATARWASTPSAISRVEARGRADLRRGDSRLPPPAARRAPRRRRRSECREEIAAQRVDRRRDRCACTRRHARSSRLEDDPHAYRKRVMTLAASPIPSSRSTIENADHAVRAAHELRAARRALGQARGLAVLIAALDRRRGASRRSPSWIHRRSHHAAGRERFADAAVGAASR